ncbi:ubiquitin-conjugating enzyme e2-24 kda [Rhizoctonia solani AG-1 IA]|uniref:Ubiquitin-conjugating enzyme e2-24 kDa n=1 Tax=Thanatephorus cucumeris (strain AG1-IA) TaxID=983506 RepID=L8WKJ6_THACA|nr:ubiquitin-conjugating enzyme e2-24 kda [Rhizoctonia solani AG-1 IA]
MDARLRRVNKEIADCKNDKASKISIELIDDNPFHLCGSFPGPEDTPYQGGTYQVVYHPNVSSASGAICLDILKDAWSPVLTLKSTLISLQSLLCSPEPDDPQDAEVAKHYLTSRSSFNDTAKYWAEIYAGAPASRNSGESKTEQPSAYFSYICFYSLFRFYWVVHEGVPRDEIAIAGLERAHVEQFCALGFDRSKVVSEEALK